MATLHAVTVELRARFVTTRTVGSMAHNVTLMGDGLAIATLNNVRCASGTIVTAIGYCASTVSTPCVRRVRQRVLDVAGLFVTIT